jgi:ribonuclease PH
VAHPKIPATGRIDGRTDDALRPIRFETHYIAHHKGSVLVSFGNTKVLCVATVEERVPPHRVNSGGGWLSAEYGMLPGSTHDRKQRDAAKGKQDARSIEIQRLIGRALRNVINIDVIGQRTINVDCDVIQADGGTRTASITGSFVAVALCAQELLGRNANMKAKTLKDIMPAQLAAVSMGVHAGRVLTDLNYAEDSNAETDLNLVARHDGSVVEVQGTAEGAPMKRTELNEMLDRGVLAIQRLCALQQEALGAIGGTWS